MRVERPLKRLLDPPTDEARIVRMWSEIRDRRDHRRSRSVVRPALGALALAAAVGLGIWAWSASDPGAAPAELRLADGSTPGALESGGVPRIFTMADGSSIELAPDTRLEPIQNDEGRFATLLARGSVRFSVTPGGPRRWVVESGLATVEVIGTVFTVDRSPGGVRVAVERGVVLVRGERVPDRVARLTRGQTIFVPRGPPTEPGTAGGAGTTGTPETAATSGSEGTAATDGTPATAGAPATGGTPATAGTLATAGTPAAETPAAETPAAETPAADGTPTAAGTPNTRDGSGAGRAAHGERDGPTEHAGNPSSTPSAGAARRSGRSGRPDPRAAESAGDPVERWLEQADDARRSGDVRAAVSLLERVAGRGGDPRAALAAFTLGRLEMDELHRPARARAAFGRALSLGLPERLARQARQRLDEIEADRPEEVGGR